MKKILMPLMLLLSLCAYSNSHTGMFNCFGLTYSTTEVTCKFPQYFIKGLGKNIYLTESPDVMQAICQQYGDGIYLNYETTTISFLSSISDGQPDIKESQPIIITITCNYHR